MKYELHREYEPRRVALAQRAFLTVWSGLGSWHDELVLIGGLAPNYLCGEVGSSRPLPRPVTLDADLGIALGAFQGQYGSLQMDLQSQGFRLAQDESGGPRFVKTIDDFTIAVDFLAESPSAMKGTVVVADVPANILPGVNRALATARRVEVSGEDLFGAPQRLTVRVCEAGPFLAMKLRAFGSRQQPKDAYDLLYTLRYYDRGTSAAIAAFAEEVRVRNPACPDAIRCLNELFRTDESPAPVRGAHFVYGRLESGESEDLRFKRQQLRQEIFEAGNLLRAAIQGSK